MKYFTKTEIKFLSQYENIFNTAVNGNYKHATNVLVDKKLGEIYANRTGEKLDNWACASCNLKNYIKIGLLYYETIKNMNNKNGRRN